MKRRLFSTFLLLMMVLAVFAKPYKITASKLNVRKSPDANGAVVGSLTQNSEVEVNKVSNGWAEITFKGKKAYISAKYITPVKGAAAAKSQSSQKAQANQKSSQSNQKGKADPKANQKGNQKGATEDINKVDHSMMKGFRATYGIQWAMRSADFRFGNKGGFKPKNIGADKRVIHGFTTGFGFEYNALVHRTNKANIMMGGRTGFSYDYSASTSFKTGSKASGNFTSGRCSYHSITFPLQPQVSFEWMAGDLNMGFGFFMGPVFEAYFIRAFWNARAGDKNSLGVENYVTGHILGAGKGGKKKIAPEERSESFNCMWELGCFLQIKKTRIILSTGWGIHNFDWTKGGNGVTPIDAHVHRPFTLGIQTVLNAKKKKKAKDTDKD